jgi:hypothetical protein
MTEHVSLIEALIAVGFPMFLFFLTEVMDRNDPRNR